MIKAKDFIADKYNTGRVDFLMDRLRTCVPEVKELSQDDWKDISDYHAILANNGVKNAMDRLTMPPERLHW